MEQGVTDYWAFIERIHDLTEYVQELLRKNGRLQRRIEDLEQEKEALASQLSEQGQSGASVPRPAPHPA